MKIRKECPKNNKYYIRIPQGGYNGAVYGQPTQPYANVLDNCVGYANGRFNEIGAYGKCKYQLVCNAENFIEAAKKMGLKISSTPIEGGIMVWQKGATLSGGDGAGHVAVVERVYEDGSIMTSESGWNSWAFKTVRRDNSNGRWGQNEAYKFRGCIINPAVKDPKIVPVPPLTVDGVGGACTVRAMQRFFGTLQDGVLSGQNKSCAKYYPALKAVEYGKGGSTCVKKLQSWLGITSDGVWGEKTSKALQKKLGVDVDGVFGTNSMKAWQKYLNENKKATYPKSSTPSVEPDKKSGRGKAHAPTKAYTGKLPTKTVRKGSKGENVKRLQTFLNWRFGGYENLPKLAVDGICGEGTVSRINRFKKLYAKKYGLKPNGVFGAASIKVAEKVVAAYEKKYAPKADPLQEWYDALKTQYEWSKDQNYKFVNPTVATSKNNGTCITLVAVALQRLGLLPSGGYFYLYPKTMRIAGNCADYVKQHSETFSLSYPNKTIAELGSNIKKGDIVGYGDPGYHTMAYMGKNANNEPIFDTMGHRRGICVTYSQYANRKINMLVRLKKV